MSLDKENITAVILAGGKGQRLEGQDKGLVSYQNKMLIEHVIERIKPQVSHIVINANRNLSRYKDFGYSVISDELSNFQGPLAGVASVMRNMQTDYIITLPCDAPVLPLDLVDRMIEMLNLKSDSINSIVVAHDGERMQTVHALIPVTLLDSLEAFLATGERKVSHWYAQHNVLLSDFSDQANAFFNINKKQQLETINSNG